MKEDILEQLVDGYLLRKPATFTKHNVKFKPEKSAIAHLAASDRNKYSVPSDIDEGRPSSWKKSPNVG